MGANILHVRAGVVPVRFHSVGAIVAKLGHLLLVAGQSVEVVATKLPRQLGLHSGECVEQGPRDDHVVVDGHQEGHVEHSVSQTLEGRGQPPEQLIGTESSILADGQLQEEEGQPGKGQHDGVSNQERAAPVFVAEIRESPDVAQAHGISQAGQEEVALVVPVSSFIFLLRECLLGLGQVLRLAGTFPFPHL